jgi:tRNA A-37 threonylcarbamoyl transferase component Bud32
LAHYHVKGVIQTDLHLGNFLIKEDKVFLLDPSTVRFRPRSIGRSRSVKQLAWLTAVLPERGAQSATEAVFRQYAAVRAWPIQAQRLHEFCRAKKRSRRSAIKRGLQKSLRTNRRHQRISEGPWRGIAERSFLEAAGISALTTGLDEAVSSGQILKNGRTCFVSRIQLGNVDVVVKRYNHKGLAHSLRHTLKGSRAKHGWVHAYRLRLLKIATPHPLAYIVEYRGHLLWCSYLITEFVTGPSLHEVLRDTTLADDQKQHWIDETLRLIDELAELNISHGDMKHTNILCNGNTIVLTDLDAMRVHRIPCLLRNRSRNDRARFLRDVGHSVDSERASA